MQPDRRCAAVMKTDASACDRQRRHARSRTTKQSGHTRHDDRARAEEDTHAHACFMWQQYSLGPCIASLTSTPAFVPFECPQRPCREARRQATAWRRAVLDADHTAKQQHAAQVQHAASVHETLHVACRPAARSIQRTNSELPTAAAAPVQQWRRCGLLSLRVRANHCTRWQSFVRARTDGCRLSTDGRASVARLTFSFTRCMYDIVVDESCDIRRARWQQEPRKAELKAAVHTRTRAPEQRRGADSRARIESSMRYSRC